MALFREVKVGRQWAADYFPGAHTLDIVELPDQDPVAVAAPAPVKAQAPEVLSQPEPTLPPAILTPIPVPAEEAPPPNPDLNWSGDPDLADDDEAVVPARVADNIAKQAAKKKAAKKKAKD